MDGATENNEKGRNTFDDNWGSENSSSDEQKMTKDVKEKGGLISGGILTLNPLPIKGANSLS